MADDTDLIAIAQLIKAIPHQTGAAWYEHSTHAIALPQLTEDDIGTTELSATLTALRKNHGIESSFEESEGGNGYNLILSGFASPASSILTGLTAVAETQEPEPPLPTGNMSMEPKEPFDGDELTIIKHVPPRFDERIGIRRESLTHPPEANTGSAGLGNDDPTLRLSADEVSAAAAPSANNEKEYDTQRMAVLRETPVVISGESASSQLITPPVQLSTDDGELRVDFGVETTGRAPVPVVLPSLSGPANTQLSGATSYMPLKVDGPLLGNPPVVEEASGATAKPLDEFFGKQIWIRDVTIHNNANAENVENWDRYVGFVCKRKDLSDNESALKALGVRGKYIESKPKDQDTSGNGNMIIRINLLDDVTGNSIKTLMRERAKNAHIVNLLAEYPLLPADEGKKLNAYLKSLAYHLNRLPADDAFKVLTAEEIVAVRKLQSLLVHSAKPQKLLGPNGAMIIDYKELKPNDQGKIEEALHTLCIPFITPEVDGDSAEDSLQKRQTMSTPRVTLSGEKEGQKAPLRIEYKGAIEFLDELMKVELPGPRIGGGGLPANATQFRLR